MKPSRPWAKKVHTLATEKQPCGILRFIHFRDNEIHEFGFATNRMSGRRMCWFDTAMYSDVSLAYIKSCIRDIYKKSLGVKEHIGDFKP